MRPGGPGAGKAAIMRVSTVLWDFDGTLADTGRDVWSSLRYAARRAGGELDAGYAACDANLADPMGEIMRHVDPYPGAAHLAAFDEDVRTHYRTMNEFAATALYPGIRELLDMLHARGVASLIVTNKPLGALERLLASKGWAPLFDDWITPDARPGPPLGKRAMIAAMIARRSLAPQDCLYVGDTFSDVDAAHANGVACVAVTYGDGDERELLARGPEFVARDPGALAALLDTITARKGA